MAAGSSLGRSVAGTVSPIWLAACAGVLAAALAAVSAFGQPATAARLALGAGVGLLAAELVHRRACARLGGVTGDVMGAMGEAATAAVLLTAAVVV
jgi:adenosylcobinamide-GDP ribazoletransferase